MSNKNKGGREARKPKAAKNVRATGQTPATTPALAAIKQASPKK